MKTIRTSRIPTIIQGGPPCLFTAAMKKVGGWMNPTNWARAMIIKTGRENRDSGKVGATPSISSHPGPELISFDGHFGGTQVLNYFTMFSQSPYWLTTGKLSALGCFSDGVSLLSPINTLLPRLLCRETWSEATEQVGPEASENRNKAPLESSTLPYLIWLLLQSSLLPLTNHQARNLFINHLS